MKGVELLDDPRADPQAVRAELRDIETLNTLFGGTRAVVRELDAVFAQGRDKAWSLLDVGTGRGDIPRAVARAAARHGIKLELFAIEINKAAARCAREADPTLGVNVALADGNLLPFAPRSFDIVIVSQVLHHLPPDMATRWIASLAGLARRAVVIADLRRSRIAMGAVWLVSFPLRFSATTRHDAVLSLQRGYTRKEMNALLRAAGAPAVARRRPGFRIVAAWRPGR